MNRERAKELLPIIEAFANGEDIQIQEADKSWSVISNPSFTPKDDYRIKPSPREFWLCWESGEDTDSCRFEIKPNQYAEDTVKHWDNYIKVREVL